MKKLILSLAVIAAKLSAGAQKKKLVHQLNLV
jgi:hypothetical protein